MSYGLGYANPHSSQIDAVYPRNLVLSATMCTFAASNHYKYNIIMKVLVINASANKERSTTLKLTKTFLEGLEVEASEVEFVTTIGLNINPCRACYACWIKTSGKCVQKDDATEVMEKIRQADLVIWSIPLYAYGVPSHCKALMDRTVSFNSPLMYIDSDGIAHHYGYEEGTKKTVLISTAGLPNMRGNFDGLLFAMRHMYGKNISYICCAEGSLFMSPDTEIFTVPYLKKVKQAGAEYKETERISDETQAYLDTPMLPADAFVKTLNGIFEGMQTR